MSSQYGNSNKQQTGTSSGMNIQQNLNNNVVLPSSADALQTDITPAPVMPGTQTSMPGLPTHVQNQISKILLNYYQKTPTANGLP